MEKSMNYDIWRETIKKHFPDYVLGAEIGLSVISQLYIEDIKNPFALVYLDVPSSGKTIILNFFSELEEVYTTDDFSPKSFVSHAANKSKEQLLEIDLLPRLKNKVLLVRDLAPIFGKRDDGLALKMWTVS